MRMESNKGRVFMNIFSQLFKSLYSPVDIAKFRFQGIGKTILYVFLLTLLSVIPTALYTSTGIMEAVSSSEDLIERKLPEFTIEDSALKSDLKEPKTINNGDFTIIFDSTGVIEEKDIVELDSTIAMLKHEVILSAGGQTNSIPYTIIGDEKMTKNDILKLLDDASSALPIVISLLLIAIYLFSAAAKFIEISILALFGLLLKNLANKNLQYRHLWRMSAYSVTLSTVFFTIMAFLKVTVPYGFIVNWFVSSMFLLLAIKEIPGSKQKSS